MPLEFDSSSINISAEHWQTASTSDFSATEDLWQGEKNLPRYNQDIISKLSKSSRDATDILDFGAGIGTLAKLWYATFGKNLLVTARAINR